MKAVLIVSSTRPRRSEALCTAVVSYAAPSIRAAAPDGSHTTRPRAATHRTVPSSWTTR